MLYKFLDKIKYELPNHENDDFLEYNDTDGDKNTPPKSTEFGVWYQLVRKVTQQISALVL